jgi:hypothetical protein
VSGFGQQEILNEDFAEVKSILLQPFFPQISLDRYGPSVYLKFTNTEEEYHIAFIKETED